MNEQIYVKSNKDYWKCRHPDCNVLIKVVNDMASEEPKHPMHTTLSDLEVATLIKLMKMQALSDPHTDLKVIYDRNDKVLTDQNFKLADIDVYLKPYTVKPP